MSLYADDMILYIGNPKLLELIIKFSNFVGYNINIQKYVAFLHINNELSERESKNPILFKFTPKRISYLVINLTMR